MKTRRIPIADICKISIFSALIAICAQIRFDLPYGVPFTLQTFAIPLAGVVLGPKKGVIATIIYILLGLIGIPVFTGFNAGFGVVFGRTGGFILSFPLLALAGGIGSKTNNRFLLSLCLVAGVAINYFCGMLMFSFVTKNPLGLSFSYVVAPFIPTDAVKMVMVVILGESIKNVLNKNRML